MPSYLDMFLGNIGGSMGETSALHLLLGGIYLIARRVINPIVPFAYIGNCSCYFRHCMCRYRTRCFG